MTRIETQVIAHRGASRMARENTVEAFRLAAVVGAHAVELDVRRTADGVLVVHHDPMLPDGRLIAGLDVADLPAHIPSLTAALDACTGMWVNVEIKNDPGEGDFDPTDSIADHTVALLQARAEDDRWVISSFRLETVDRCRALAPAIRTAWLTYTISDGVVGTIAERGHAAWHPWVGNLTRATTTSRVPTRAVTLPGARMAGRPVDRPRPTAASRMTRGQAPRAKNRRSDRPVRSATQVTTRHIPACSRAQGTHVPV